MSSVISIDSDMVASQAQSQLKNVKKLENRTKALDAAIDALDPDLENAELKRRSRQLRDEFGKGSKELRASIQQSVDTAKAALGSHWSSRAIRQRTIATSENAASRMAYLQTLSTIALESAANEALRTRDSVAAAAVYEEVERRHEQGKIDLKVSNFLRDRIGNLLDSGEISTRNQLFDIIALGIDADLVSAKAISGNDPHPISRLQAHRRKVALRRGEGV